MKELFRPWPRWAKIVRNLTVTALLALFLWAYLGTPLTVKGELRRFERQCLLPRGEIVLEPSTDARLVPTVYVSISDVAVVTVDENKFVHTVDPLTGNGPELFPLRTTALWVSNGQVYSAYAYILVHPPEGASGAVLTVTNRVSAYTAEGKLINGVYLFIMPPSRGDDKSSADWWEPEGYTWEITYYDEQGNPFEV